jgi:hypothetical protein
MSVVVPSAKPVTVDRVALRVAADKTLESPTDHVMLRPVTTCPLSSFVVAVACMKRPALIDV